MEILVLTLMLAFATGQPVGLKYHPMESPLLFEGDIRGYRLTGKQMAVPSDLTKWPEGIIPYEFNADMDGNEDEVKSAMAHIEDNTCLRFVSRTDEENFLEITTGGGWSGCSSDVGQTGGNQALTLGYGCYSFGTLVHELMHSIGFLHEHTRSDRDEFITILWDNIDEMYQPAFQKIPTYAETLLTPFDFESIMMYGQRAFASGSAFSIRANDGRFLPEVSEKQGLSESDIERIKILYECP